MIGPVRSASLPEWRLDTVGALVGLSLALVLFPLRYYSSQIFVQTIPLVLGAASGLYLLAQQYDRNRQDLSEWRLSPFTTHVMRAANLVGLAGLVYVAVRTGGRTISFYIVATLVGSLVFGQVFFAPKHKLRPVVVLAQLLGLALIVR